LGALVLLLLMICLSPGSTTAATLDTGATLAEMAAALDIEAAWLVEISATSILDTAAYDSRAIGVVTGGAFGSYLPVNGTDFLILDCGDVGDIPGANDVIGQTTDLGTQAGGGAESGGDDGVKLKVVLNVPDGMHTFSFTWHFLSEEYPEWVGSAFNDFFFCEVGGTDITYDGATPIAPLNVVYDYQGKIMSVNSDFFIQDTNQVTGTEFDGQTILLRTCIPCTPGENLTLYFSIADMGDAALDSAVFLDNFLFAEETVREAITVDAVTATVLGLTETKVEPIAYPNPFIPHQAGTMNIEVQNLGCGVYRGIQQVEIYTMYGILVRRIVGDGDGSINWDGTNENGSMLASGTYYYIVTTTDNKRGEGKFTLIK